MAERLLGAVQSNEKIPMKNRSPGKGSIRRSSPGFPEQYADTRRIMVAFDEQTFAKVRLRAQCEQTSFAEQIRLLVSVALDQAK